MLSSQSPVVKIVFVIFLAAGISTLCDANHVYTGTLSYTDPVLFGQAWWVFPNFLLAFSIMAIIYHLIPAVFAKQLKEHVSFTVGTAPAFLDTTVVFTLCYLLSGFAQNDPNLLALILYLSFAIRLLASYERGFILFAALLMALGGSFVEGTLSVLGQMQYAQPQIYHVPLWLGALYMNGAFCLRESFRYFVYSRPAPIKD